MHPVIREGDRSVLRVARSSDAMASEISILTRGSWSVISLGPCGRLTGFDPRSGTGLAPLCWHWRCQSLVSCWPCTTSCPRWGSRREAATRVGRLRRSSRPCTTNFAACVARRLVPPVSNGHTRCRSTRSSTNTSPEAPRSHPVLLVATALPARHPLPDPRRLTGRRTPPHGCPCHRLGPARRSCWPDGWSAWCPHTRPTGRP